MNPIWLIVEYASARLMSNCPIEASAAYSAETRPITSTTVSAVPEISNRTCERTTRYTPAVTIVAAWISAETGVGPSMASGSQTWSGSWADLPIAPASSSSEIAVAVPCVSSPAASPNTVSKSSEPTCTKISATPSSIAASPILVVTNAFFAALDAAGRSYQKPINR